RVENIADESREPLRLAADQGEERLALVRRELTPALLQRLRRSDDRRHRRSQLVRDERDEVGAQRREPAQLVDGAPLGLVGPDVLDGGRNEPTEQGDE